MRTLRWELFSFSLPFKKPLRLKGYNIYERKGLIIRLYSLDILSNEIFGEGEIIPFPGLHSESLNLAEKQIRSYLSFEHGASSRSIHSLYPSVRFGLDMAERTLFNNLKKFFKNSSSTEEIRTYDNSKKKIKIPVNGLITSLGSEFEKECKQLLDQGFQAVKIKVGQLEIKEDLKRVKLARKILGDKIELRLDANRSWNWDQALNFLSSIKEDKIHYCEEPLRDITKIEKLYDETKIPLALDETIWEKSNPKNLPKEGIKAYILKPCLLGGWYNTKLWIDFAEIEDIQVILSSSFETGLGLNWNAYLSANLIKKQLPSGLDTVKWFKHDIIDPPFEIKNGFYVFPDSWPEAKNNYLKFLDKGTFLTSF